MLFSFFFPHHVDLSRAVSYGREDGKKYPHDDGKAEQVPGPALHIMWGRQSELGSAKVQGTSSG